MAKNAGIRKTIQFLLDKVQALENQNFGQKLLIDELENKLEGMDKQLKEVRDNPFGMPSIPFNIPAPPLLPPLPNPLLPSPYQPIYTPNTAGGNKISICMNHVSGSPDANGDVWCTNCGKMMLGITWTTGTFCQTSDSTSQSSSGVEDFELDLTWDDSTT